MFKKWSVLGGKKVEGKKGYTPPTIPSDDAAVAVPAQEGGGQGVSGSHGRTAEEELWLSSNAGAIPLRSAAAQQATSNPMFDGMRVAEGGVGHAPHVSEQAAAAGGAGSSSAFPFVAGQEQPSASTSSFGFINPGGSPAATSIHGHQHHQQHHQATTPSAAEQGEAPSSSSFGFISQSPAGAAPPPIDGSGAKKKKMAARRPGYAAREGSGSPAISSTSSRRAAVEAAVAAAVSTPPPPQTPQPPQRPSEDEDAARRIREEEEEEEERAALEMERAALALQAEFDSGLGADESFIDQGMKAAEEASLKQLQEDERARAAYEDEQMRVKIAMHSSPSNFPGDFVSDG